MSNQAKPDSASAFLRYSSSLTQPLGERCLICMVRRSQRSSVTEMSLEIDSSNGLGVVCQKIEYKAMKAPTNSNVIIDSRRSRESVEAPPAGENKTLGMRRMVTSREIAVLDMLSPCNLSMSLILAMFVNHSPM
jgi:hypothetical protein